MTASVKDWERPDAATEGFLVPPGEGDRVPTKPNARRKAGSRNTGGAILVDEAVLVPGEKIPPHRHSNLAEFFYVLAGEVLLQIGNQMTRATAGTFAFSPIDNVHGFSNLGSEPARLLIVALPPEPAERYFEAMDRLPPDADAAAWARLLRENGVESAGPPLEG
jgi:quercetin dioxygenase-like cupin family protein